ncbi:MAG: methyltransferase domain-containing protein [Calditrichaeota bacterium]|nr:MAG: methyltransferase domain-containing protein [Calditrichota bacterium]
MSENAHIPKVILKKGREKSVLMHHPWIFSGAIEKIEGRISAGNTAEVYSSNGEKLGAGAYSPHSQIRLRLWSFQPEELINEAFIKKKINAAIEYRKKLDLFNHNGACRLIFSESDGLPGLIVDKYASFLVCQFLSVGVVYWKETIIDGLIESIRPVGIYERSDSEVIQKEGLKRRSGLLWGKEPPHQIEISENDINFLVDIRNGHKTGFYLDQRNNRRSILPYVKDKEVLNCFSYSGGFGIYALEGGAKFITQVDSSAEHLKLASDICHQNGFDESKIHYEQADVFQLLRQYEGSGRKFDLIILDPPKFITSSKSINSGSRGYKDINRLAMKILDDNGILFTFSCSGLLQRDLFQKIIADAAVEAGKTVRIISELSQSPDHPIALNFPESRYLKGLIGAISNR